MEHSEIYRGGYTSSSPLSWESGEIKASTTKAGALRLGFTIGAAGGGCTVVELHIEPPDFATICAEMAEADRQSAMEAMSSELHRRISRQPALREECMHALLNDLQRRAQARYEGGEAEWDVLTAVKDLFSDPGAPDY